LKRLHRLAAAALGPRAGFAAVALAAAVPSRSWHKPLIAARGTWDIAGLHPRLSARGSALRSSLSPTPLCLLMARHGSDKGLRRHNYTVLYDAILARERPRVGRLFELGIGTADVTLRSHMGRAGRPGASLRAWRDYFPSAHIFAADIDRNVLFAEDRIACFHCDQTDPESVRALWANPALALPFDVIIDDGLHELGANRCFLEHSFAQLAPGGLFIVEDVLASQLPAWESFLGPWARGRPGLAWAVVEMHHPFNAADNNLVLIRNGPAA